MRICQLYTSPGMSPSFAERMQKKYGLQEYRDRNQPAIFYGFFSAAPPVVAAHKSIGVILWAGTDALRLVSLRKGEKIPRREIVEKVLEMNNVYHICRSECIRRDFEFCKLPYKFVRVSPTYPWLFSPKPLGPSIYCYGQKFKPEKYGAEKVQRLREIFPGITFLSKDLINEPIPYERMHLFYTQCFLGLRLTKHDGLPNSVLEMGLMGRKSVYNGDIPGSIPYNSFDDIVDTIKEERKKIGCPGSLKISNRIRDMLNISDDWLDTDFYIN